MRFKVGDKVEAIGGPCIGMRGVVTGIESGRNTPYSVKYDDGTVWQNRECNIKLFGNYAVINGERIELTADQIRALDIKPKFDIELHLELSRLLWQFAIDNGGVPEVREQFWVCEMSATGIHTASYSSLHDILTPRFASRETAQRAIDEIVTPFLAAHPDFRW